MSAEYTSNLPTCPECGHRDEDWLELLGDLEDGDRAEVNCPNCETPYLVLMSVSYSFTTSAIEDEPKGAT
jgi:hypothetical protein